MYRCHLVEDRQRRTCYSLHEILDWIPASTGEILASQTAEEVLPKCLIDHFHKYTLLSNYILERIELVSYSLLKKEKLVGRWETPLVPMQKGKHWNAKYLKPQL